MKTPILPPIQPSRLYATLTSIGRRLGVLADVLATWSWWRVIGLSLLLFISAVIIDSFLFPERKGSSFITINTGDGDAVHYNLKMTPKGPVLEPTDGEPADKDEQANSKSKGTVTIAESKTETTASSKDEPNSKPASSSKTDRSASIPLPTDSQFETKIEKYIERVIEDSLRKSGKSVNGPVRVDIGNSDREESPGPFKAMAFLSILLGWILKIIGGSRLREQAATIRANVATASAESQTLQRQVAEAKLLRMQAQVEPHFLFNTLAALERLIETNPTRALAMSQALSQWLRALLPQMKEGQSNLGAEVTLIQNYLQLMQMRMGDRLAFTLDVPEALRAESLPSMLLQPLVENSIKHGIEMKKEGGQIIVRARKMAGYLQLDVEDTGVGFSANPGNGNGLSNLRERLELIYNGKASVSVMPRTMTADSDMHSSAVTGTVITLKLPI
jgi:Histidine kinase